MSIRYLFLLSLVAIGSAANTVLADIVVSGVPAPSRYVAALGTGSPGDGASTAGTGSFSADKMITGISMAGTVITHAVQSSTIPPPLPTMMAGGGHVDALVTATGTTGFSGTADSFFDVFFTVSVDGTYLYHASVAWTGDDPTHGGFSSVKLTDQATPLFPLSLIDKGPGDEGSESLGPTGILLDLSALTTYRLQARSLISAGGGLAGMTSADGGWSFDLTIIPEPDAWALWVPIVLGLAMVGGYRRIIAAYK